MFEEVSRNETAQLAISHQLICFEQETSVLGANAPTWTICATTSDAHGVSDINSVSWFPTEKHGDWLASGGDDGNVNIWRYIEDDV